MIELTLHVNEELTTNIYRVFTMLYNDIPNVIVWRVLRKRLHLNAYNTLNDVYFVLFKCKRFRNISHTTFVIPLLSSF
jgi:hypothetical protein